VIKRLTQIFLLFFLTGCSTLQIPPSTNQTVSQDDICTLLSDIGAGNVFSYNIRDDKYEVIPEGYIEGEFTTLFGNKLKTSGSELFASEENDCDDFTISALDLMATLHRQNPARVMHSSIAFGEFYYHQDKSKNPNTGHAINVAIVDTKGGRKVLFYDPQEKRVVHLSKQEIQSCYFWRF
jgi:hypothetical protein